jgi:PAS domain S-box-containing protein
VLEEKEGNLDPASFQLLIDSVVDYAIYMIGLDGRVRSWNAGAARLKGYRAEEIVGRSFGTFYAPEDQAAGLPQKALQTARDTGRFAAEGWRVRKDGSRFWASVVIDAIRDANGELVGFAKITRDVTDRQKAQQQLIESERRYRRLIESVIDYAIFQLDPSGIIATWNPVPNASKVTRPRKLLGSTSAVFIPTRIGMPAFPRWLCEQLPR